MAAATCRRCRPPHRAAGTAPVHITANQVTVPMASRSLQVGPVDVTWSSRCGHRRVKIEPDVDGRPAPGFEVVEVKSDPESV